MPEKYNIEVRRQARKELDKLQKNIFLLVVSKIKSLEIEPRQTGTKKLNISSNDYRLRVGNYRILYEIDDKEKIITIFRIKHRKDVYRNI